VNISVVAVDDKLFNQFWSFINKDRLDYFFFIYDWIHYRDKTSFYLAIDDEVYGAMLIYRDSIVQLRGLSENAVMSLIKELPSKEIQISAPSEYEGSLLDGIKATSKRELLLMYLDRYSKRSYKGREPCRLSATDALTISRLLKSTSDGEFDLSPYQIIWGIDKSVWLGIRDKGELVSICRGRFNEFGSLISAVVTHRDHRNKGYATSILSYMLDEALEISDIAILYVVHDNKPAIHLYKKLGFRPYKSYIQVSGTKII
jgi:RimJ/RimL family protein N-acetyltransferase